MITSFSILKETRRAMIAAAASWSNPAIKSYNMIANSSLLSHQVF